MACNFYLVQSYSSHLGINVSDASRYIFVRKKLLYVKLSSFSTFFCKIILIKRQYDHSLILVDGMGFMPSGGLTEQNNIL
jgi:hypothetical protein